MSRVVIIGAGSNLGAREASIRAACELLDARDHISVHGISPLYQTEPLGPPQPRYLNAAYRIETTLSPLELLQALLQTERRLGRRRHSNAKWGPRSIDLDLLWDEHGPHDSEELQVPHPQLEARDFALRPLLDVAPELGDLYGKALRRLRPELEPWARAAIVRETAREPRYELEVEADSIVDACVLSARLPRPLWRPWSTRHQIIEPTPEALQAALRALFSDGFATRLVTISDCSDAQWTAQFHGFSTSAPSEADVRLWTTSGTERRVRAHFSISRAPR